MNCTICHEPIELRHTHSNDTHCGTGDGSTALPPAAFHHQPQIPSRDAKELPEGSIVLVHWSTGTKQPVQKLDGIWQAPGLHHPYDLLTVPDFDGAITLVHLGEDA